MLDIAAPAETATDTLEPDARDEADFHGYIDNASRYDGSRTSPQKTLSVIHLSRAGRSLSAISQILAMDERTVKAILARQDSIITDGRMLLKANTLGFVGDAIQASSEAAKRGKLEGISAMLDRLGVTEPPKAQNGISLGVQVVLNGGAVPSELGLSRAKVGSESVLSGETLAIQAQSSDVNISALISPSQPIEAQGLTGDKAAQVISPAEPEGSRL